MSHLRPNLIIRQEFTETAANVATTQQQVLLLGLNRAFNASVAAGVSGWTGASAIAATPFPLWKGGTVDNAGSLVPKLEVKSSLGTAVLPAVFANLGTSPTFALPSGSSATFQTASGTAGSFALNVGVPLASTFIDSGVDMITSQVFDGDIISVSGVPAYKVAAQGLVASNELKVSRLDLGGSSFSAAAASAYFMGAEDADGIRTMTAEDAGFAGSVGFGSVQPGYRVNADYWTVKESNTGLIFTAVAGGANITIAAAPAIPGLLDRQLTLNTGSAYDVAGTAAWNNTTLSGGVFFLPNSAGSPEPAFYATTVVADNNVSLFAQDYATNSIADPFDSDLGIVAEWYDYGPVAGGTSLRGEFGALSSAQRVFTDTSGINFSALGIASGALGDHVAVRDTDGIYRPVFRIDSVDSATQITVSQFGGVFGASTVASNVDYAIIRAANYTTGAAFGDNLEGTPAALAGVGGLPFEYTITEAGATFTTSVATGDLVFSASGELLGIVVSVGGPTVMTIEAHPNASADISAYTGPSFAYSIRGGGTPATFVVQQVVDSATMLLVSDPASPNTISPLATVRGFLSFQTMPSVVASVVVEPGSDIDTVTVPDSISNQAWSISRTQTGSALSGELFLSYSEVLNDRAGVITAMTPTTYAGIAGDPVPENPLGLAASLVAANTSSTFYSLQVATDDAAGWAAALSSAEVTSVYQLVPLTQVETIISTVRAHVAAQSLPAAKHERIVWQSGVIPTQVTRITVGIPDGSYVARDSLGIETVTVTQDLTSTGTAVGDDFVGQGSDGTTLTTFGGRITAVAVLGGVTTLTIVPDGLIALNTPKLLLMSYSVTSRVLTQTEHATAVADYAKGVADRRVRNIYPEQTKLTVTDATGVTGTTGTTYVATVGSEFLAAATAGFKAAVGPTLPLTGRVVAGVLDVVDPFLGNATLQDIAIDGGTFYMQNISGAGVSAIRALTTDVTTVEFLEESVTTQIDNFARTLRAALSPLIGPYIIDQRFFDVLSTTQQGVRDQIIKNKNMKSVVLKTIQQDPNRPDGFLMSYGLSPFFSSAHGDVTLFYI